MLSGPQLLIVTEVGIVSAHPLEMSSVGSGVKKSIVPLYRGSSFLPWGSFCLNATRGSQCLAVFNFEVLNTSLQRLISTQRLSICLVKVCCCSLHVCAFTYYVLSFLWNSAAGGAGVFLFASFPGKYVPCLPVLVILCECICIKAFISFKHYWNRGIMKQVSEIEGFVVL